MPSSKDKSPSGYVGSGIWLQLIPIFLLLGLEMQGLDYFCLKMYKIKPSRSRINLNLMEEL